MVYTGIIRRIDDLGRVCIPKEIRKSLNIREGDALEVAVTADHSMIGFIPLQSAMDAATLCDCLNEVITFGNYSSLDVPELRRCLNQLKSALRIAKENKEKEGI